jgi:uncharacterized membrane protein YcaP (DUF421 family)
MATILHVIFGYFFLLLTVRVLSRRPGAQLTMFEFVIVFLIGGVIMLATVGKDRSVTNCTIAIITVALMHRTVAWMKTLSPRFGALVDGTALVVLKRGEWQEEIMRRMRVDKQDVMTAARAKGLRSIEEVRYAVLERNGAISILKGEDE